MKANIQFKPRFAFCIFLLSAALSTVFSQDTGQKLCVTRNQNGALLGCYDVVGNGAAHPTISGVSRLDFRTQDGNPQTIPNNPCTQVVNQTCGWYKGFWIFGDGNYQKFSDDFTNMDASSRSVSHTYLRNGTYNPVVYLTEKYHNENPPEAARTTINVTDIPGPGNAVEITRRLDADITRTVDIDFNHPPRVKYPMNLVVSYRVNDPVNQVLLYYNSLRGANSSLTPADLMNFKKDEPAVYLFDTTNNPRRFADISGGNSPFPGTAMDAMNAQFKSALQYEVRNPIQTYTAGLTELRVFPVLESFSMQNLAGGRIPATPAVFVAILVGNEPLQPGDTSYSKIFSAVEQLLGDDISTTMQIGDGYIRGIEMLQLQMLQSHDPNSLFVTDIRDLGNGKFRAFFRMVICNDGELPEPNPSLIFNDLTGGKFAEQPKIAAIAGVTQNWSGGTAAAAWQVGMPGFQIGGISCRSVDFTIDTDADGVQRLYQKDPRALNVCVNFSAGAGDCSENEPLSPGAFQGPDGKYMPIEEESCDLLTLIFGALASIGIIAMLLGYLFKKKKQPQ